MGKIIEIDLSKWKMKQFRQFTRYAVGNDMDGMIEMLEGAVTFKQGVEGVDDLELSEWGELLEAVNEKLTAMFQPPKRNG